MSGSRGKGHLPPGPTAPGAVQMYRWMFRPIPFMESCRQRYGSMFTIRLGGSNEILVVADPAHAMDVLAGDPRVFDSGAANLLFRPVVGEYSLLLLDGDAHMRHREIMLPHFKPSHVGTFTEAIERAVQDVIERWPTDRPFHLAPEMEDITYQAISRITFGESDDPRLKRLGELMPDMMDRCDSPFTLMPQFRFQAGGLSPFARLQKVLGEIDELLNGLIEERRADPLSQLRDDVLSLLLRAQHEDGSPLGNLEIRDELITLLMAGYETTTAGLTWAFERILREPRVLRRLTDEIAGGEETYLDATIKETLRARPVVPIVARKVRAPVAIGEYSVPAGSVLMANVYLIHQDPDVYPEPEQFRPERFLDGLPDPRAWVPFGGGVRRCLGASFAQLEMKIVIRTVLRELELTVPDDAPEPTIRRRFTFVPKHDGLVQARKRAPKAPANARQRGGMSAPAPNIRPKIKR
jgi:cytochrome P450 family 135